MPTFLKTLPLIHGKPGQMAQITLMDADRSLWRRILRITCIILSLVFPLSSLQVQNLPAQSEENRDAALLARIVDEFWQDARKSGFYRPLIGGEVITELPDISENKAKTEAAFARHIARELRTVNPVKLNHQDWLTLKILKWETWRISEEAKYYWFFFQITPYISPIPLATQVISEQPLRNGDDLEHYLVLLGKYAQFIRNINSNVHEQARRGIIVPKAELSIVMRFLSSLIQNPEKSSLLPEAGRFGPGITSEQAASFRQKAIGIIRAKINPALTELNDYVGGDYAKKASASVGASQYPGGRNFYRYLARVATTLDLSPEEIHRIGLEEVQHTEEQMAAVRRELGFKGTREEFHHYLKTEPEFFPKSPEDIEARLNEYLNRVLPVAPKYFLHVPKAPYGIKRLPPGMEAGQTFGHYELPTATEPRGIYYYNGSHLNESSLLPAGALLLHELIPGHHFQANLQQENTTLPPFRRASVHLAYTEGWGNYSSALGQEMGVYENLYDVYGMLMTDMRHSVRLVVDTGMNYMGWSRERAMAYMREHGVDSEAQIESESLRYSVDMPGQALAYKMGSREIWKLREQAQRQFGDKFDIRKFHDCFLGSGSMPLAILEKHMEWCMGKADSK